MLWPKHPSLHSYPFTHPFVIFNWGRKSQISLSLEINHQPATSRLLPGALTNALMFESVCYGQTVFGTEVQQWSLTWESDQAGRSSESRSSMSHCQCQSANYCISYYSILPDLKTQQNSPLSQSISWNRVQPPSGSLVSVPKLCIEVSQTVDRLYWSHMGNLWHI